MLVSTNYRLLPNALSLMFIFFISKEDILEQKVPMPLHNVEK